MMIGEAFINDFFNPVAVPLNCTGNYWIESRFPGKISNYTKGFFPNIFNVGFSCFFGGYSFFNFLPALIILLMHLLNQPGIQHNICLPIQHIKLLLRKNIEGEKEE